VVGTRTWEMGICSVCGDHAIILHRILLLGGGNSGKTTILKQATIHYGLSFTRKERLDCRNTIYANACRVMAVVLSDSEIGGDSKDPENLEDVLKACSTFEYTNPLPPSLARKLSAIWKDSNVQRVFQKHVNSLPENSGYFLDKIEELAAEGYLPSDDDVVRARLRTTGVVEKKFTVENQDLVFIDVGGQYHSGSAGSERCSIARTYYL